MLNSSSPGFRQITAAAMLFALLVATSSVHVLAAKISIKNQCVTNVTACDSDQYFDRVTCYGLTGGGKSQVEIDVGATWDGAIWGLPNNLGDGSLGFQAFSQWAYNLPLMVKSTSNQTCPSFNCTIDNLRSFCQAPNSLTGEPGSGCRNEDGYMQATNGTRPFSAACPGAINYVFDPNLKSGRSVGSCRNGGNYEVVFCP